MEIVANYGCECGGNEHVVGIVGGFYFIHSMVARTDQESPGLSVKMLGHARQNRPEKQNFVSGHDRPSSDCPGSSN